jgi:hypothetical protein
MKDFYEVFELTLRIITTSFVLLFEKDSTKPDIDQTRKKIPSIYYIILYTKNLK